MPLSVMTRGNRVRRGLAHRLAAIERAGETVVWVYAITVDLAPGQIDGLAGVGGEQVRAVTEGGLTAVVGSVDAATFDEDSLPGLLSNLASIERVGRLHHQIIAVVAAGGPVLPLRLATVYPDDSTVRSLLAKRGAEFAVLLESFRDTEEWGVKVYVEDEDGTAPAPAAAGDTESGMSPASGMHAAGDPHAAGGPRAAGGALASGDTHAGGAHAAGGTHAASGAHAAGGPFASGDTHAGGAHAAGGTHAASGAHAAGGRHAAGGSGQDVSAVGGTGQDARSRSGGAADMAAGGWDGRGTGARAAGQRAAEEILAAASALDPAGREGAGGAAWPTGAQQRAARGESARQGPGGMKTGVWVPGMPAAGVPGAGVPGAGMPGAGVPGAGGPETACDGGAGPAPWDTAESCAEVIDRALSSISVARRRQPATGPEPAGKPALVLSAVYLLSSDRVGEFATVARALANIRHDIRVEVTGPWPPYSFADMHGV